MAGTGTLLQVLALLLVVDTALGLHCFNCNSRTEPRCKDPFDEAAIVYKECNADNVPTHVEDAARNIYEVKEAFKLYSRQSSSDVTCQKFVFNDGAENVTIRTCSVRELHGADTCGTLRSGMKMGVVFCEQCDSSLCNTSSVVSSSALLYLIVSLIALAATL